MKNTLNNFSRNKNRSARLFTLATAVLVSIILASVALLAPGGAALAADDTVADLTELQQQAFQAAVRNVADSVVWIDTVGGMTRVDGVPIGTGSKSGLVVSPDGHVITSSFNLAHKPTSILIRLPDGSRKAAQVVAVDHSRRLTLLKIDLPSNSDGSESSNGSAIEMQVPEFGSNDDVRVGQWAITVARTYSPDAVSMTVGVISGKDRIWGRAIQSDAAISQSNYGGPLIDLQGRVVGIITPCSPDANGDAAGVEWYDSGIGFAVASDDLLAVLPQLIDGKDQLAGLAGIRFKPAGVHTESADIISVHPGSPADEAGIEKGDQVIQVDGQAIQRAGAVRTSLGPRYAGDSVKLTVLREKESEDEAAEGKGELGSNDSEQLDFNITLVDKLLPFAHGFLGVLPMRDATDGTGITVRYVYPNSPANVAGIEPADRITRINGQPALDSDAARQLLPSLQADGTVKVQWLRGDEQHEADLTLAKLPELLPDTDLPSAYSNTKHDAEPGNAAGNAIANTVDGQPDVGVIELSMLELEHKCWVYVSKRYSSDRASGLVVLVHAPDQFDKAAILAAWQPLCDSTNLILVMPEAKGGSWQPTDLDLFRKLAEQVKNGYNVDPSRIVAHGQLAGGSLATALALRNRDLFRGSATVDSPVMSRPPENVPDEPFALLMGISDAKAGKQSAQAATALRKMNYPVTELDIGPASRRLTPEEMKRLARWIDMLDRL